MPKGCSYDLEQPFFAMNPGTSATTYTSLNMKTKLIGQPDF